MKLLTLNFLTCAIKTCKSSPSSFPLHPRDAELEIVEADLNLKFLENILPRLMWDELRVVVDELGLPTLPPTIPTRADLVAPSSPTSSSSSSDPAPSQTARDLHRILIETCVREGKLVCGNCGHEYAVKEGVANFLLPAHLV
ncbi:Trm112p-domain-containing protein [Westerdykella ornata]|uniref:Trm112p-domain-containing protein n=1 Tax=Westerdykella ornata TaxID=318751 RepID=A0A6A6JY91_WESOR|nr:Trm112p-domain-containing protein [Westerdykella ornata]KAF2280716.1 Trm112p-domain-containing protein [Westerdykella ornata]